jgi:hypothetical protein
MRFRFISVFALILCICLVFPVAATINKISQGGDIFLGEKNLDVSAATGHAKQIAWWESGRNPNIDQPTSIESITDVTNFYLSPEIFSDKTGIWYQWINGNKAAPAFNVKEPSLILQIWDSTTGEEITDKSIPVGNYVNFLVETNMQSIATRAGYKVEDAPFTISVFSVTGGDIKELAGNNGNIRGLKGQTVNKETWFWVGEGDNHSKLALNDGWNTAATDINGQPLYAPGFYAVWIDCNVNGIKDNFRAPDGSEYSGKTTSFVGSVTLESSSTTSKGLSSGTINTNTNIPYTALLRNPDLYEGDDITITGNVIQAIDTTSTVRENGWGTDGQTVILVTNYGDLANSLTSTLELYYLFATDKPLGERMINGDIVTLTFRSAGLITYTQANGAAISVPGGQVLSGTFN